MSTISIHGLDPEVEKILKEQAKLNNKSLSRFLKDIIEKHLKPQKHGDKNQNRFAKFSKRWTDDDYREFCSAIADFERINPDDWK